MKERKTVTNGKSMSVASRDWEETRRRLDTFRIITEQIWEPSPSERAAILKARANAQAVEETQESTRDQNLEILEFQLAHERYAIETSFVREVYLLKEFTPLPGTPDFILGIMNFRGQVLSIVDMKKFFHLPEKGLGELNKVIILRSQRMEFGILADAILGTRSLRRKDIQPAPATIGGVGGEYLLGVTTETGIILNGESLLHDSDLVIFQDEE